MPKIRNILIFVSIAAIMVLVYIFFIKKSDAPAANLVTTGSSLPSIDSAGVSENINVNKEPIAEEFLKLLLSVKNIKLDDSIFSEPAWNSLKDSSIVLVPDGTEGRPNPFAPFGTDNTSTQALPITPASPATPPPPAVLDTSDL